MNTPMERAFATRLRNDLIAEVERRGWDREQLAQVTGLLPAGVTTLMERPRWDLDSAVLVASALGLQILPRLEPDQDDEMAVAAT